MFAGLAGYWSWSDGGAAPPVVTPTATTIVGAGSSGKYGKKRKVLVNGRMHEVSSQHELMRVLEELMHTPEPQKRAEKKKSTSRVIDKGVPVIRFSQLREFVADIWEKQDDIKIVDLSKAIERFKQLQADEAAAEAERIALDERDIEDLLALADADEREAYNLLQHQLANILRMIH